MISMKYIQRYLWLNKLAYAIVAFPIGTVLSVAPLFLHEQKDISLTYIGWAMAAGEAIGIVAMKTAERSKGGFIFPRPHDLHFISFCVAVSLILIPVWSHSLWYLSAFAMMLVQTFNSASKPVVGESLHRLSVLLEADPINVFAQANMMRRIGNAVIGIVTPLMYIAYPIMSFYVVGGLVILFLCLLLWSFEAIKEAFQSFVHDKEAARENQDFPSTQDEDPVEPTEEDDDSSSDGHHLSCRRGSVVTILRSFKLTESQHFNRENTAQADEMVDLPAVSYSLTVHAFPMLDAAISRLPFAFLTVAIADESGVFEASMVLFAYQMSRAIAQFIQAWRCTPAVGYALNACAFCAYTALVVYIEVYPDGGMWFIPFTFAGLAETLPTQQYYLIRMYGCVNGENMNVRRAVKASHTGTGLGSMLAFLTTSQIYNQFGVYGVAYLGISIQTVKILVNVIIDLDFHVRNRKVEA